MEQSHVFSDSQSHRHLPQPDPRRDALHRARSYSSGLPAGLAVQCKPGGPLRAAKDLQVLEEFPSHVELCPLLGCRPFTWNAQTCFQQFPSHGWQRYSHMSSANPEQSEPSKSALDLQE